MADIVPAKFTKQPSNILADTVPEEFARQTSVIPKVDIYIYIRIYLLYIICEQYSLIFIYCFDQSA